MRPERIVAFLEISRRVFFVDVSLGVFCTFPVAEKIDHGLSDIRIRCVCVRAFSRAMNSR